MQEKKYFDYLNFKVHTCLLDISESIHVNVLIYSYFYHVILFYWVRI